jgi:predicted methyltransferase
MNKKLMSLAGIGLTGAGLTAVTLLFSGLSSNAMAAKTTLSPMQQKVKQAMNLPARKAAEIKRDHNRSPMEAMAYEVGRKSVSGNTDRFTLVFKKPL